MNTQNLEKLQEKLMYAGFGQDLNAALEKQMKQGTAEFQLSKHMDVTTNSLDFKLYFKKSEKTEDYYFNKFDVRLTDDKGKAKEHTFYQNQGVSAKEAFNLLQGRAVNKNLFNREGTLYNAWLELDFKNTDEKGRYQLNQYHENYGYDLEKELAKLPLAELKNTEQRDKLIYSLKKGNLHTVKAEKPEGEEKLYIRANPQYKGFGLYNETMQRMGKEDIARLIGLKSQQASAKKQPERKQGTENKRDPNEGKDTKKEKGQTASRSKTNGKAKKTRKAPVKKKGGVKI